MRTLKTHGRIGWLAFAAAGLIIGCSTGMPYIRAGISGRIKTNASPTFNWYGSRTALQTYWGEQDVSVAVSAYVPDGCTRPEQTQWDVKARNAEGKPLPFIGLIRRYTNENGTELATLVSPAETPPIDVSKLPDCLYVLIDPQIQMENGKLKSIRPAAVVREVRRHYFMPFQAKVPLTPEHVTPITPAPDDLPGTPVPTGTPVTVE